MSENKWLRSKELLGQGPDFHAHYSLGLAYLNLRQWRPAVVALRAASALHPDHKDLRTQLNALMGYKASFERKIHEKETRPAGPCVLVVDDSPTVRTLVAMTLEKQGYRVVTAADGEAAAGRLREARPALILLDIMMPGMDGYQVCKLVRRTAETAQVPVVMLSGKDGFFDKIRGKLAGATEHMSKPFEPAQLVQMVGKYCPIRA